MAIIYFCGYIFIFPLHFPVSFSDAHCIDEVDALGRTPLMYAINFGQLDVIQLLLENGAELNAVTHGRKADEL